MLRDRQRRVLEAVSLFALTVVVYLPIAHAGFIWDDSQLIASDPAVTAPQITHIWKGEGTVDYTPLTISTFWLEWRVFNLHPFGYHADNLLLHALNTILLWVLLRELTVPGAWIGAALFALHPVCVESVAWIAERKNTLSMCFYLLAALWYIRFEKRPRVLLYAASLAMFALALLAKASAVMLPCILLAIAWWLRGSVTRKDIYRTAPFFAFSAVIGVVTIWFQYHRTLAGTDVATKSLTERLALAGEDIWFYISKVIAPVGLTPIYPEWPIGGTLIRMLPLILLIALAVLLWRGSGRWGRTPFFVLSCYVLSLLPVLGLFKMAYQFYSPVADHFQYNAIPVLVAAAAAAMTKLPRPWLTVAAVAALTPMAAATMRHETQYTTPENLFRAVLKHDPHSYMGHKLLGMTLAVRGRYTEADQHLTAALALRQSNSDARHEYGRSLLLQGRAKEAAAQFRTAIAAEPKKPDYHNDLGVALLDLNDLDTAVAEFQTALQADPAYAAAQRNLAIAFGRMGKLDQAAAHIHDALRISSEDARAHDMLGLILMRQGDFAHASQHFAEAVRINPAFADARDHLKAAQEMKMRAEY
jgi:Tfp pilus assembly protein PilF